MQVDAPTYDQLMIPTLKALQALGGSGSNVEIVDKIIELEKYPESIQKSLHTNGRETKIAYNSAWARTYLKWYGAIENSARGVWSITDRGEKLTDADIEIIRRHGKNLSIVKSLVSHNEAIESETLEQATNEESWKERLLQIIQNIQPAAFERLAQRILRESGFVKVEVTGKSNDGGIDGVGVLRINLLSFHVLFQCKRYKGSVGSKDIRDFRGAMAGRSDKGLFITTGTFTSEARKESSRDGAPAIDLIDGDTLCDILKNLKLGIKTEIVENINVDTDWFKSI